LEKLKSGGEKTHRRQGLTLCRERRKKGENKPFSEKVFSGSLGEGRTESENARKLKISTPERLSNKMEDRQQSDRGQKKRYRGGRVSVFFAFP